MIIRSRLLLHAEHVRSTVEWAMALGELSSCVLMPQDYHEIAFSVNTQIYYKSTLPMFDITEIEIFNNNQPCLNGFFFWVRYWARYEHAMNMVI